MGEEKSGILDRIGLGGIWKGNVQGEDELQMELEEFERRQAEERQAFLDSRKRWTDDEIASWKQISNLCTSRDDMGIKMLVYNLVREIKLMERENKNLIAANKSLSKQIKSVSVEE